MLDQSETLEMKIKCFVFAVWLGFEREKGLVIADPFSHSANDRTRSVCIPDLHKLYLILSTGLIYHKVLYLDTQHRILS